MRHSTFQKILVAQHKAIEKRWGKRAAENANYGWGTSNDEVSTKVYLKTGHQIITTDIRLRHTTQSY